MVEVKVAVQLYNDGNTLKYIGELFGVSKQRIWQLIKKTDKGVTRKHKKQGAIVNTPSEKRFIDLLRIKNFTYERMGRQSSFDFIINGKRVELKYLSKTGSNKGTEYFKFSNITPQEPIDYYVFMCGDTNTRYYIVPFAKTTDWVAIPLHPKRKKSKSWSKSYLNNWDPLRFG